MSIDAPAWTINESFQGFACANNNPDLCVRVVFGQQPLAYLQDAQLVARMPAYSVYEKGGRTFIRYPDDKDDVPTFLVVENHWREYTAYINPDVYSGPDAENAFIVRGGLSMHLREVFAASLTLNDGFLLHCAAIEHQKKGIVFSAPSQTGKSTQAHLWQRRYGVRILDGDVAACRLIDGKPVIYGLPWCGSSGESSTGHADLAAVVFLEQAKENKIRQLSLPEAVMRMAARSFLPLTWSDALAGRAMDIVQQAASQVNCYLLQCLPDIEAVELVKQCIGK